MKLGKLFKAAFNTVTLPIEIVKDIVTLGGVASEEPQSYTKTKIEEIEKNLDDVTK
ncbi:MAG TPA: hypothetical protein PLO52_00405 [Flavobacterium alvei]|nr:hypothetical protein [Flavobacterium alvei]